MKPVNAIDVSHRIRFIFTHPKKKAEEEPHTVAVDMEWLMANGIPITPKGKRYDYHSVVLLQ